MKVNKAIQVTVERADGSRYQAQTNGWYEVGGSLILSVGRKMANGNITHGILGIDERVVAPAELPTPKDWPKSE